MCARIHVSALLRITGIIACFVAVLDPCSGTPYHAPTDRCPQNEIYTTCVNACNNCEQRGQCYMYYACRPGCDCKRGFFRNAYGQCIPEQECLGVTCAQHEEYKACANPCNDCERRGRCTYFDCNPGCDCIQGYYRDEFGVCVREDMCSLHDYTCPKQNEVYSLCKSTCHDTCDDYLSTEPCKEECRPGCSCRMGFVRNHYGECVQPSECRRFTCGINEEFKSCVNLCNTCESLGKCQYYSCDTGGCDCKPGFLRNASGVCIPENKCPIHPINMCAEEEQFYDCMPDCKNTCANYFNDSAACPKTCKQGCFCREGLVRNHQGHCVDPTQCEYVTCKKDEVFWPCMPLCDSVCNVHQRQQCSFVCRPGCFCRAGLYKRDDGACVEIEHCPLQASHNDMEHYLGICKANEDYYKCMPYCTNTCEHWEKPYAHCPVDCKPGCFCKKGLVENRDGQCVAVHECENYRPNLGGRSGEGLPAVAVTQKPEVNSSTISNPSKVTVNDTNVLENLSVLSGRSLVGGVALPIAKDNKVTPLNNLVATTASPLQEKLAGLSNISSQKPIDNVDGINLTERSMAPSVPHGDDANLRSAMSKLLKFIEKNFPDTNLTGIEGVKDLDILHDDSNLNISSQTPENETFLGPLTNKTAPETDSLNANSTNIDSPVLGNETISNSNSSGSIFQRSKSDGILDTIPDIAKKPKVLTSTLPSTKPSLGIADLFPLAPKLKEITNSPATDLKEKRKILENLGVLPILNNVMSVVDRIINFLLPKTNAKSGDKSNGKMEGTSSPKPTLIPKIGPDGVVPGEMSIVGRNLDRGIVPSGVPRVSNEPPSNVSNQGSSLISAVPSPATVQSTGVSSVTPSSNANNENMSGISPNSAFSTAEPSDLNSKLIPGAHSADGGLRASTVSPPQGEITSKKPGLDDRSEASPVSGDNSSTDKPSSSAPVMTTINAQSADFSGISTSTSSPLPLIEEVTTPVLNDADESAENSNSETPDDMKDSEKDSTLQDMKAEDDTPPVSTPRSDDSSSDEEQPLKEDTNSGDPNTSDLQSSSENPVPEEFLSDYDVPDPEESDTSIESDDKDASATDAGDSANGNEAARPAAEIPSPDNASSNPSAEAFSSDNEDSNPLDEISSSNEQAVTTTDAGKSSPNDEAVIPTVDVPSPDKEAMNPVTDEDE